jgi:hypothetical protein
MDEEKKLESPPPEELERLPTEELPEIDHVAERKLVRKLDLNIVWVVMALYLFSFLDRYAEPHHCDFTIPRLSYSQS